MGIERFAYCFFGNNVIIGPHIRKQLKFLREIIPPTFQRRQMDDLGCGDGKITLRLKEIFLPGLKNLGHFLKKYYLLLFLEF